MSVKNYCCYHWKDCEGESHFRKGFRYVEPVFSRNEKETNEERVHMNTTLLLDTLAARAPISLQNFVIIYHVVHNI